MTSIISVVIGALLGSMISMVSFQYKERKVAKEKYNKSLFNLLSVWSSVSAVSFLHSDNFSKAIVSGLRRKYPHEDIPPALQDDLAKGVRFFSPIRDHSGLYSKYNESIEEVARLEPVLAFRLSSNKFLLDYLEALNKVSDDNPDAEEFLLGFRKFAYEESLLQFEKDLVALAKKLNKNISREVERKIASKKEKLSNIPESEIDEYLDRVLEPAMKRAIMG